MRFDHVTGAEPGLGGGGSSTGEVAVLMAAVAESLHRQSEMEDVLRALVAAARDTIPGVQHAGISLAHRTGGIDPVAGTGAVVYQLDDLQHQLGEGPTLDALSTQEVDATPVSEGRWPRYTAAAARLGIGAGLGMPLVDEERSIAVLTLYSATSQAFSAEVVHVAELFAVHAAHALGRAAKEQQLTEALHTRKVIGQALGILMERFRIGEARAFTMLVRTSQTSNTKLRRVAARIVDSIEPTDNRGDSTTNSSEGTWFPDD